LYCTWCNSVKWQYYRPLCSYTEYSESNEPSNFLPFKISQGTSRFSPLTDWTSWNMALLFNDAWPHEQVIVVEELVGVICKWNWVIFHCVGELRSSVWDLWFWVQGVTEARKYPLYWKSLNFLVFLWSLSIIQEEFVCAISSKCMRVHQFHA